MHAVPYHLTSWEIKSRDNRFWSVLLSFSTMKSQLTITVTLNFFSSEKLTDLNWWSGSIWHVIYTTLNGPFSSSVWGEFLSWKRSYKPVFEQASAHYCCTSHNTFVSARTKLSSNFFSAKGFKTWSCFGVVISFLSTDSV